MLGVWKIIWTETCMAVVFDCLFFMFVRYVDMIANPEVADVFRNRAKVFQLPNLFSLLQMFVAQFFLFFL